MKNCGIQYFLRAKAATAFRAS